MIGFGSWGLGRFSERLKPEGSTFVFTLIIYALIFPLQLLLARAVNTIIGMGPGEIAGLLPIFYSCLLVLTPLCLLHGFQFPLACRIMAEQKGSPSVQVGKIYIAEALGAMAGGVLFTYFMVHYFNHLEIAIFTVLFNLVVGVVLLSPLFSWRSIVSKILVLVVGIAWIVSLSSGTVDKLDYISSQWQWKEHELVHVQNSVYQNVAVTQKEGQLNFFGGGILLFTAPVPDITFVEDISHFPLLHHPAPKRALVIGGAAGILEEMEKYYLAEICYVEPDPVIIETIEEYLPAALSQAPRVNLEYTDGRHFVQRSGRKFDVVIMNLPSPSTLQLNRFYTREFFDEVQNVLSDQGIFAFSIPSSEAYMSEEMMRLNRSIYSTLGDVFPAVSVIPGDFDIFLASPAPELLPQSIEEVSRRFEKRGLETKLFTTSYIEYKLSPQRVSELTDYLDDSGEMNSDSRPIVTFYNLAMWNSKFYPHLKGAFDFALKLKLWWFIPCLLLLLAIALLNLKRKGFPRFSVALAIFSTGFTGMALSIALLFSFQVSYGYLYQKIGILIGIFMLGIALGGFVMNRVQTNLNRDIFTLGRIELVIAIYAFMLPWLVSLVGIPSAIPGEVPFSLLNLIIGFLVGLEFPLACKIYLERSRQVGKVTGFLGAADLWGSVIGVLLTGVLLIPVLGLVGTCWVAAMFTLASLILLLVTARAYLVS